MENQILPEVVYAYGLKEAVHAGYLKKARINGYQELAGVAERSSSRRPLPISFSE